VNISISGVDLLFRELNTVFGLLNTCSFYLRLLAHPAGAILFLKSNPVTLRYHRWINEMRGFLTGAPSMAFP
jgi:hypothetical protein